MTVYYNEIDKHCCDWLENLMLSGLIPYGHIDNRSISDVVAADLAGYTQCHFFAGLGGWLAALELAEWPHTHQVWTGSCPCQPFSAAGKRKGFQDERHLWPDFKRLIAECKPPTVFGEQVANATAWVELVYRDLEAMEYAVGCYPIEAASVGANHRRDRFWFVADATYQQQHRCGSTGPRRGNEPTDNGNVGHAESIGWEWRQDNADQGRRQLPSGHTGSRINVDWFVGPDGKTRPVESGLRPVIDGVQARVAKLRAFGNAIDPRPAAAFITAYRQCVD